MTLNFKASKEGVILTGPVTNLAAAAVANAVAVFALSAGAQQVGTKSMKIKKVWLRNNAAGTTWVHVGTGAGATYADLIPALRTLNNFDAQWQGVEIPDVESFATITAYPDALVGGTIDIQVEVEERG